MKQGSINELEGRLNFIDSVDKYNHMRPKPSGVLENKFKHEDYKFKYRKKLNVREKTFSKFLYYSHFYANTKPTILCEGKTDNIYLKSAINVLSQDYPLLAKRKTMTTPYELLIDFIRYSKRTNFLLNLDGGGTFLKNFVECYIHNIKQYKSPRSPSENSPLKGISLSQFEKN